MANNDRQDESSSIVLKSPAEIEKMRVAGRLAAQTLTMITPYVKAGVTTEELDRICHEYITEDIQCIPAPLNYRGFPKSICTSINHQVCHGIPSERKLKKGDILNIDVTVIKDGYHGDTSKMFVIGKPSVQALRLIKVTYTAMRLGIEQLKPGQKLGDVGSVIQNFAEKNRFSVVRDYCGHGIGTVFHEAPSVLHFGKANTGIELKPGMTLTVEPMINAGTHKVKLLSDDWTVVTNDHSLSAQWEHTIAITKTGYEILTLRPEEPQQWDHSNDISAILEPS